MATRKNDILLRYLAAAVLAVATWLVLRLVPFYPDWLAVALAVAVGAFALLSPGNASILMVGVIALPVIAADFVIGMFFLIGGLVVTQYLSDGRAGGFVLAAIGIAAIPLHGEWAAIAVAGYLLGRNRGAAVGAAMAVALIALGLVVGTPVIGTLATGGSTPALSLATPPENALAFAWVIPALKNADPVRFFNTVLGMERPLLLASEVALWAFAGAIGGFFVDPKRRHLGLIGVALAAVVLAAGHVGLDLAFDGPMLTPTLLVTLGVSLPLALLTAFVAAWVFPVAAARPRVVESSKERDVDELLRVIASAEDELASRHNTEAVVLITDMKSFSAMTEEIGSVESAKIVQRHRDLLLPIIRQHKGQGAPTGGDGLVACFKSPGDAVHAAIAMQRALDGYTGSDRSPHELSVRIGIASGEVVVDAAGTPFLGAALNLAARVMDLADGGRIMVTSYVAAMSNLQPERLFKHGEFKLKNIAEVIPVVEVLWRDGGAPQEIRAT